MTGPRVLMGRTVRGQLFPSGPEGTSVTNEAKVNRVVDKVVFKLWRVLPKRIDKKLTG